MSVHIQLLIRTIHQQHNFTSQEISETGIRLLWDPAKFHDLFSQSGQAFPVYSVLEYILSGTFMQMKKIVRNNVITSLFVSTCMLCMESLSLQWIHGTSPPPTPPPPRSAPKRLCCIFSRRFKIFTVCKTHIGRLIRQWVHLLISLVLHWGQTGSKIK